MIKLVLSAQVIFKAGLHLVLVLIETRKLKDILNEVEKLSMFISY